MSEHKQYPSDTKLQFDLIYSPDPKVKYGFLKELLQTAKGAPESIYPYFKEFSSFLNQPNNIIKWTGMDLIGYLSSVDKNDLVDEHIPQIKSFLQSTKLVSICHSIFALGLIARNKPVHRDHILKDLIEVERLTYESEDCKNIAVGKVLESFQNHLIEDVHNHPGVLSFLDSALHNPRNATVKKAVKLKNKIEKMEPNVQ